MADDPNQRTYRSHDTLPRANPARPAGSTGSDPLAELARLIGQSDPFGEFGANSQRRIEEPAATNGYAASAGNGYAAPQIAPQISPKAPAAQTYEQPAYNPPPAARQNFGGAPLASDIYQTDTHQVPGYAPLAPPHPQDARYDDGAYPPSPQQLAPEEEDFYEDESSGRRRMGVLVIAGIFALAVIGTAGAFGYRAIFGSSASSGPPPVIKADTQPSKIVPASNKDTSNKQITDRVNDRTGSGERLVSREEQPVDVKDKIFPQDSLQPAPPQSGSGVVGNDPKRIRTIPIRPDGSSADAQAAPPQTAPAPAARAASTPPARPAAPTAAAPAPRAVTPPPQQQAQAAEPDPEPAAAPAPRQTTARASAPPVRQAAAPSANAPMSLSPDAPPARPAPAPKAAAPTRTASAPAAQVAQQAAAPAAGGGAAFVQVSSQRSEAEAQSAFQALQGKFPAQLGGKQPVIRKVDLGDKGTFYRAMVPAGSSAQAVDMCTAMKAAGGSCLVQRN